MHTPLIPELRTPTFLFDSRSTQAFPRDIYLVPYFEATTASDQSINMSPDSLITEKTIPFSIPTITKPCVTWYKIIGSVTSPLTPLIVIHGGPGLSHDYLICLAELNKRFGIPLIFYDQIGTGLSTHLAEKNGDEAFWADELFINELLNLTKTLGIDEREGGYDVLGHSWGGMLAAVFAAVHPPGLRKLIISNSPATSREWVSTYRNYRDGMPEDIKGVLYWDDRLESEEYEKALMIFYKKHMCSVDPWPEEFLKSFDWAKKDGTVALTTFVSFSSSIYLLRIFNDG
jgi:L-proline amide hydrolase